MTTFIYDSEIIRSFPDLRAGIIISANLDNRISSKALNQEYTTEQQAVIAEIGDNPISEIGAISAWRAAFRKFGVNPTKYRCAPEALLRRLSKKGDIPSINKIVDCCNLVSIRYKIAVAGFDVKALTGAVTVRFSNGTERYTPLGENVPQAPEKGEVIFADESDLVIARRWCWRQSDDSAVSEVARRAIFSVEGQHAGCMEDVKNASGDLLNLLKEHVGGEFNFALLGSDIQKFTD